MFGYIRPVRPELLVREDELYGAVYCGLCRYSGKHITHFSRFLLNYDFTFLAVLRMSLTGEQPDTVSVRCPYKLRKQKTVLCTDAYALTAKYFGLFTYYKVRDDLLDEKGWKRLGKRLLLPIASRMRKKALRLGADEDVVRKPVEELRALEKEACASPDRAADCFARLLSAVAAEGLEGTTADIAAQCGYHIGRFVYLIDALDDLEEDAETGNYNPFLLRYGSLADAKAHSGEIATTLEDSMRVFSRTYALHCGPVLNALDRILFNISDLGGPAAVRRILAAKNGKKTKRRKKKDKEHD